MSNYQNNSFIGSENSNNKQLFLPSQLESIKLSQLRNRRRQLEQKLKLVSNRIGFRKKKEEDELRRYIRSQERTRMMSQTKNFKRFQDMLKEQIQQKRQFQTQKKAKEVYQFRLSQSRRLQLISQAMRDRKQLESEKVRRLKRNDEEMIISAKNNSEIQVREKHDEILKMKQRQMQKKKHYWFVEKRLTFQQNMIEEAQIYEKQIHDYYKKIQSLRKHEQELRLKEEHASEVLRCAEQNYELLKKA